MNLAVYAEDCRERFAGKTREQRFEADKHPVAGRFEAHVEIETLLNLVYVVEHRVSMHVKLLGGIRGIALVLQIEPENLQIVGAIIHILFPEDVDDRRAKSELHEGFVSFCGVYQVVEECILEHVYAVRVRDSVDASLSVNGESETEGNLRLPIGEGQILDTRED